MSLKLYNTLTKRIDKFVPISNKKVGVYTCGPTVYDHAHIGHWFTYVRIDTLIRLLKILDYKVDWIMNITDVGHLVSDGDDGEDKLQKGAIREGKTAWQIAQFYTNEFLEGMKELNITMPNKIVKATDHISDQIELIKKLEVKGLTYKIDDGIYFNTALFPEYSQFAQLDIDDQQAGIRVSFNSQKKNKSDFALWKFSPKKLKRDMEWNSPWGIGFPGWHIECSAMSMKYLGETFDIHTGGIDHIPVHHTNEIAQSKSITGKPLANFWLHTNHITIDNTKISKSLGNSITLSDIKNHQHSSRTIRLHVLESHYRSQSKFSYTGLNASKNRLKSWDQVAALIWQIKETTAEKNNSLNLYQKQIIDVISNDLNSPLALSIIDDSFNEIKNKYIDTISLGSLKNYLQFLDTLFGLKLLDIKDINDNNKKIIRKRIIARENKDWKLSDKLRDTLSQDGIGLIDNENITYWFYL